jgi:pimeloyl-ACP methyl ester carboxylesterase
VRQIVAGAGVELASEQRGSGPAVLLIHDMAGTGISALSAALELAEQARVIAYARRGYAGSGAPEPYTGTTVQEQAEDAAAVLGALAPGGALLAGEGFGALIALDVLLRHGAHARGAVLLDPPLLAFAEGGTRELAEERARIEVALRDGGPGAGVDALLDGRPDRDAAAARASARAVFADYAGLASWPITRAELRSIAAPVLVLTAARTPPHVRAASDALASLLADAGRREDGDVTGALRELLGS